MLAALQPQRISGHPCLDYVVARGFCVKIGGVSGREEEQQHEATVSPHIDTSVKCQAKCGQDHHSLNSTSSRDSFR